MFSFIFRWKFLGFGQPGRNICVDDPNAAVFSPAQESPRLRVRYQDTEKRSHELCTVCTVLGGRGSLHQEIAGTLGFHRTDDCCTVEEPELLSVI